LSGGGGGSFSERDDAVGSLVNEGVATLVEGGGATGVGVAGGVEMVGYVMAGEEEVVGM
jgi:hypothetical protein